MRILVTGASSRIGQALAIAFSPENHLILVGRNPARLEETNTACLGNSAVKVEAHSLDMEQLQSMEAWQELIKDVDLIVHASSSISRTRDDEIAADDLGKTIAVELMSPVHLFAAAARSEVPRCIIFISSFLAKIPSPQRLIYGSSKLLQEECLRSIERAHPKLRVLTVTVGTVIPVDRNSPKARILADRVVRAYQGGARTLTHGRIGQLFVLLFYIQPMAYFLITAVQRRVRKTIQ